MCIYILCIYIYIRSILYIYIYIYLYAFYVYIYIYIRSIYFRESHWMRRVALVAAAEGASAAAAAAAAVELTGPAGARQLPGPVRPPTEYRKRRADESKIQSINQSI